MLGRLSCVDPTQGTGATSGGPREARPCRMPGFPITIRAVAHARRSRVVAPANRGARLRIRPEWSSVPSVNALVPHTIFRRSRQA